MVVGGLLGGEEHGGGVVGDGEGFAGGEGGEGGAGEAEGATVVGVSGGEVVARVHRLLHEAAAVLAPSHRVLVFELGRRAAHGVVVARGVGVARGQVLKFFLK